ncbi:hypothetical protein ACFYPA_21470 [Streptomyces sp. NPDC005775]|uniref:hypothetical protein n=1 Tax=Streptomyces sp. NPDC005775 TaxID=3364729 RepID=UPI00367656BB
MASEVRRTIPRGGRIDVQHGYLVANGDEQTLWRRGMSTEPAGLAGVVYDPSKPKLADFTADMPENVQRREITLLCLTAVAIAMLVLMAVGALP